MNYDPEVVEVSLSKMSPGEKFKLRWVYRQSGKVVWSKYTGEMPWDVEGDVLCAKIAYVLGDYKCQARKTLVGGNGARLTIEFHSWRPDNRNMLPLVETRGTHSVRRV